MYFKIQACEYTIEVVYNQKNGSIGNNVTILFA